MIIINPYIYIYILIWIIYIIKHNPPSVEHKNTSKNTFFDIYGNLLKSKAN